MQLIIFVKQFFFWSDHTLVRKELYCESVVLKRFWLGKTWR